MGNANPTDPKWLNGPAAAGKQEFIMPWPGKGNWTYTPRDMTDFTQMDYTYDDLNRPGAAVNLLAQRLANLGVSGIRAEAAMATPEGTNTELIGASPSSLKVRGAGLQTEVKLQPEVRNQVAMSLKNASVSAPPDRVILNLENVRGAQDAHVLNVFVNLPPDAKPSEHPELLAGSVALFGVTDASFEGGEHGGQGLNFSLDISKLVDRLHLEDKLNSDSLGVTIVPNKTVGDKDDITIGRISIFRKGR